jgi:ribonuclease T2
MRLSRLLICIFCLTATSAALGRGHGHREGGGDVAGRFDYYLMSLSWSPSFCETHPQETSQCAHQGYGFVLHGLWPQNRNGSWPQHCSSDAAPDEATVQHTLAFMPSRHLIEHEWETHGACTGLDPHGYFDLADHAFASVKVPGVLAAPQRPPAISAKEVVSDFVEANPGLSEDMISVTCHDGYELTEVRVCLNKDSLAPQACGGRVRNSCRMGVLKIPASR